MMGEEAVANDCGKPLHSESNIIITVSRTARTALNTTNTSNSTRPWAQTKGCQLWGTQWCTVQAEGLNISHVAMRLYYIVDTDLSLTLHRPSITMRLLGTFSAHRGCWELPQSDTDKAICALLSLGQKKCEGKPFFTAFSWWGLKYFVNLNMFTILASLTERKWERHWEGGGIVCGPMGKGRE